MTGLLEFLFHIYQSSSIIRAETLRAARPVQVLVPQTDGFCLTFKERPLCYCYHCIHVHVRPDAVTYAHSGWRPKGSLTVFLGQGGLRGKSQVNTSFKGIAPLSLPLKSSLKSDDNSSDGGHERG